MTERGGTPTTWSYFFIRLLFKFALKIFYGTIVVENVDYIPSTGEPCIVCANHSNSLTDALLLVTSIPSSRRNMLRLTAKSTQFGKKTFTSWLIESAGTVPLKRRKDYGDTNVDNALVMGKLMEALELGDAVCLFPEGMSRYYPSIAPLKTGVARLVSDVLSRNRDNPDFEISILTCSITYMNRQHFRSDVLVTFNQPLKFSPKTHPELLAPVDYSQIRLTTALMHHRISNGTLDSPSWDLIRTAKSAANLYVPLGTRMKLGSYVRVVKTFLDAFKLTLEQAGTGESTTGSEEDIVNGAGRPNGIGKGKEEEELKKLMTDLKTYQDTILRLGITDNRVRFPPTVPGLLHRLIWRFVWSFTLLLLSLPGLMLWAPIFVTTFYAVSVFKRSGPVWDTYDEIAQYKLVYGLISFICVLSGCCLVTFPIAGLTAVLVPCVMWMGLRWFEDAVAGFRAFVGLAKLLRLRLMTKGSETLKELKKTRKDLYPRVMKLAKTLGLPEDPETFFALEDATGPRREKGRVRGTWESQVKYFSVRRRRKRDWNETLRLYEQVNYPG